MQAITQITVKEVGGEPLLFVDHVRPGASVEFRNGTNALVTIEPQDPELWEPPEEAIEIEPGCSETRIVTRKILLEPHQVLHVKEAGRPAPPLHLVVESDQCDALAFRFEPEQVAVELRYPGGGDGYQVGFAAVDATAAIEISAGEQEVARMSVPPCRLLALDLPAPGKLSLRIAEDADDTRGGSPAQSGGTKQVDIFIEPMPADR